MSELTQRPVRGFGFWTGWFVVIASMVGSGILTNSGPILRSSGSYTALLITWAVGGILALCGAYTMGEVASGMPRTGGDYTYVREAFGPAIGFVYGWAMVVIGFGAPIALVAYTFANYLFPSVSGLVPLGEKPFILLVATFLIIVFTLSHCLGHKSSSSVQIFTTFFNFVLLGALPVLALFSPHTDSGHIAATKSFTTVSLSDYGSHLILVLYAYTGWNAATYISGEIRDPQKNLPRTLGFGCLAAMGLYLAINWAYAAAISPELMARLSENEFGRLAEVTVSQLYGPAVARLFSLLVSLGILAALSAYILTGPRIVYAMAQDGLFPGFAAKIHSKSQVPVVAILVQGMLSLLFLWTGTFEQILGVAGYGLAVVGVLAVAPIFVLRRRPDFKPPFRVPLYPFTPALFLLVSLASLVVSFVQQPGISALSIASILAGFPLYFILKKLWLPPGGIKPVR